MEIQTLIKELNELEITQKGDWLEDVPQSLLKDKVVVAYGLNIDKHRHYETAVDVLEYESGIYMGVQYCSNVFSEQSSIADVAWTLHFFEMEAVPSVIYKRKEIKNANT